MAKMLDVSALRAAGMTDAQIKLLQEHGAVRKEPAVVCKVVDYTTTTGKRDTYLNVATARVFIKASQAESVIKALQAGLERFQAGEVDETKAAKGTTEE